MRLLILLGLLLFSVPASAATIRCDNCAETTYQSKAIFAGIGIQYVYDLTKAQARKYEVWLDCDENLNDGRTTCTKQASSLSVEPEVANFVLELTAYYQVTHGTMRSNFTIDADGTIQNLSAFDVAGPGGPRTQLFNWFNSTQLASINNTLPALGAAIHNITVTVASMWNDSMGQTLVTVQFPDGSKITLAYEVVNGTIAVVKGSAQDKYGNLIPTTADELDGARFDYSAEGSNGPAQQRMQNYLAIFGLALTGIGTKWSCVRVGDGKWSCGRY